MALPAVAGSTIDCPSAPPAEGERESLRPGVTVLVPAYNEAESIADTVRSLQEQTHPVAEIVVIDDFSTDATGEVARACGATVVRPPRNTGSKAGAQNFALSGVETEFTMAIDADTVLAPDAIEKIIRAMDDPAVAAACGLVIPRHVRTLWERGRYVEYLFAFQFYKPIQDYHGWPLISSGCFSIYRSTVLFEAGGWSTRTMAEDMDLTWSLYQRGHQVRFLPGAVSFPIEPHNFHFMSKQLRRWAHGFIQNVVLHWRYLLSQPFLRSVVGVALWDGVIASIAYLFLLPLFAIFVNPLFLLGYVIDLPAVMVPVMIAAVRRREGMRALASMPGFLVLRWVNCVFMLQAVWSELVLRKRLLVYEKGH
jgi:cellulose synthase/poly-beta-1,6-N-acetylglucosamine synthase-like glycosyltransferase